jgi:hypothetical protein
MKFGRFFLAPFFLCTILTSCSFDYTDEADHAGNMPEITLSEVTADRYETRRKTVEFNASALEIYDSDAVWAGKDVSFTQYAEDDSVQAEGASGLLLVDNNAETYSLGSGVTFRYIPDDMLIAAADLRWEKKTHWLSGPADGEVHIQKGDGTDVRGNGLSADTLTWTFELRDYVRGELRAKSSTESSDGGAAQ